MIPPLESLTLSGWHPDAGVWYLLLAVSLMAVGVLYAPRMHGSAK